jgi:uncharacterized membrane protein YdbT with pleckstrin-like domain
MRRPDPRLILLRTVLVARSAWLVFGMGTVVLGLVPPGWHLALVLFMCYFAYTRCVQVLYDFLAVRYSVDQRGFSTVRGLLNRDDVRLDWTAVVAVSVRRSILHRLLGVADVHIAADASESASQVLPGLRITEANRILRLNARNAPVRPVGPVGGAAPDQSSDEGDEGDAARMLTPALARSDFVWIGVYSGAFAFFVPAFYSAASEAGAWFGMRALPLPSIDTLVRLGPHIIVGLAGGVLGVSVIYGAVIAWVRYRGFTVRKRGDTELVFEAGLAQVERRVIALRSVAAYELRRPVLMVPVRRVFLRAVVRGEKGHVTRGMLLPIVRSPDGVRILCALTGLNLDAFRNDSTSRWPVVLHASTAVAVISVAVGFFNTNAALSILAVSLVLIVNRALDMRLGRVWVSRSDFGRTWLICRRGVLFQSTWVVDAGAVDVSSWRGWNSRYGSFSLAVRGRWPIRLPVWPIPARVALRLRRDLQSEVPLVCERTVR